MNTPDRHARRPILHALVGVAAVVVTLTVLFSAVIGAYTAVQVRHGQKSTHTILQSVRHSQRSTRTLLEDVRGCTSPTGTCYKRAARQTRGAVDTLGEDMVYAVICNEIVGPHVGAVEHCIQTFLTNRPQPRLDRGTTSTSTTSTTPAVSSPTTSAHPRAHGSGPVKHPSPTSSPTPTSPSPSPTPRVCLLKLVCIH
jgi:hypothetical protein